MTTARARTAITSITLGILCLCGAGEVHGQSLTKRLLEEGIPSLASAARAKGDGVRGAILFAQQKLACVKCHQSGADDLLGPDLTRLGRDTTDQHVVESLLDPSRVIKKEYQTVKILTHAGAIVIGRVIDETGGQVLVRDADRLRRLPRKAIERIENSDVSSMPADLVDQLDDRQQFLDLSRYLMDLASRTPTEFPRESTIGGGEVSDRLRGLALMDHYRCTGCHAGETGSIVTSATGPNLVEVAGSIDSQFLVRYLNDPAQARPGTSMPHVLGGFDAQSRDRVIRAIVAFLRSRNRQRLEPIELDPQAATRGREVFHTVGCVACHSPRDDAGRELLPEDSVPLGQLSAKYSISSLARFLEQPLVARPSGRMPDMKLTHWEAIDLAHYLADEPGHTETADVPENMELLQLGRQFYLSLGCANCHEPKSATRQFIGLMQLRPARGCMSLDPDRQVRYELSRTDRASLAAALRDLREPLGSESQLELAMHTLRCFNCHQRNALGGVSADRDPYFHTHNQNLGPQGRIPPTLTKVGAKLKPKWMRQVLVSGRAIRPYLKTRMPQYGTAVVEPLMKTFQQHDRLPPFDPVPLADPKEAKRVGTQLVGRDGLNCVACHTFQQKPAPTMPAVDLTEMAERLHRDWFAHYMRAPQSLSPGTVMPSFWPGGKAIRTEILDGDTELQIETIWHYLQDGRQARQPQGLDIKPMELVAGSEAVMLRRRYPDIGKRGIGVGYPSEVNLVFDAEQLRLAMLWKGKFADPGGVWRGQGSGTVRPLSREVIRLAPGPDLDDATEPWIVDDGRPPRHRFKGYHLDSLRRPAFTYQFDQVQVDDYFVDRINVSSGTPILQRLIRFETDEPRRDLQFRVASGPGLEKVDQNLFRLHPKLLVRIVGGHTGKIVTAENELRLVIPLQLAAGATELEVHYVW